MSAVKVAAFLCKTVCMSLVAVFIACGASAQTFTSPARLTEKASWSARSSAALHAIPSANNVFVFGGESGTVMARKNVYTSSSQTAPGRTWADRGGKEIPAKTSPMTIYWGSNLFILGGMESATLATNDVWSFSGNLDSVQLRTAAAPWARRGSAAVVKQGPKVFIIGGSGNNLYGYNDVWSSTDQVLKHWTLCTQSAPFPPVPSPLAGRLYNGDLIYVDTNGGMVWRCPSNTNCADWTLIYTASAWGQRQGASLLNVWAINSQSLDTIMLVGGKSGLEYKNDIWVTIDGSQWSVLTSKAPWSGRAYAAVAWIPGQQAYWIAGGESNVGDTNDVWQQPKILQSQLTWVSRVTAEPLTTPPPTTLANSTNTTILPGKAANVSETSAIVDATVAVSVVAGAVGVVVSLVSVPITASMGTSSTTGAVGAGMAGVSQSLAVGMVQSLQFATLIGSRRAGHQDDANNATSTAGTINPDDLRRRGTSLPALSARTQFSLLRWESTFCDPIELGDTSMCADVFVPLITASVLLGLVQCLRLAVFGYRHWQDKRKGQGQGTTILQRDWTLFPSVELEIGPLLLLAPVIVAGTAAASHGEVALGAIIVILVFLTCATLVGLCALAIPAVSTYRCVTFQAVDPPPVQGNIIKKAWVLTRTLFVAQGVWVAIPPAEKHRVLRFVSTKFVSRFGPFFDAYMPGYAGLAALAFTLLLDILTIIVASAPGPSNAIHSVLFVLIVARLGLLVVCRPFVHRFETGFTVFNAFIELSMVIALLAGDANAEQADEASEVAVFAFVTGLGFNSLAMFFTTIVLVIPVFQKVLESIAEWKTQRRLAKQVGQPQTGKGGIQLTSMAASP